MPILACPFWLPLAKETNVDRHRVQSKVYQVRGVARLEADRLALEWSGSVEITEILGANVRNLRQSVPAISGNQRRSSSVGCSQMRRMSENMAKPSAYTLMPL